MIDGDTARAGADNTFTGANTFSGANTFTSTVDMSGATVTLGTVAGTETHSGTVNFDGPVDCDGTVDLTGSSSVTAPTQTLSNNSTKVATTAYVDRQVGQVVSMETGAVATGTTQIPTDDTIPQITEGAQYMTLAITPKSATSKLVIEVTWVGANTMTSGQMAAALFQDSTANALAAVAVHVTAASLQQNIKFTHVMTSGATSATTFKVRAGGNSAGTTTFNGNSGGRIFGGAMASSIVIREVLP